MIEKSSKKKEKKKTTLATPVKPPRAGRVPVQSPAASAPEASLEEAAVFGASTVYAAEVRRTLGALSLLNKGSRAASMRGTPTSTETQLQPKQPSPQCPRDPVLLCLLCPSAAATTPSQRSSLQVKQSSSHHLNRSRSQRSSRQSLQSQHLSLPRAINPRTRRPRPSDLLDPTPSCR